MPARFQARVKGVAMYVSWLTWERAPWFRVEDDTGMLPIRLVIADDNRACVVDAQTWATVFAGEFFSCERWRFPR